MSNGASDLHYVAERYLAQLLEAKPFDAVEVPEEVVIKHGHKYLYSDAKWTYDIRLAKRVRRDDAETILKHFDEGTVLVAAPKEQTGL